jgi:hypothetical protein
MKVLGLTILIAMSGSAYAGGCVIKHFHGKPVRVCQHAPDLYYHEIERSCTPHCSTVGESHYCLCD